MAAGPIETENDRIFDSLIDELGEAFEVCTLANRDARVREVVTRCALAKCLSEQLQMPDDQCSPAKATFSSPSGLEDACRLQPKDRSDKK